MAKSHAPHGGNPTKEIKEVANNGMYTTNPALSIPYIKYYTSILEEYDMISLAPSPSATIRQLEEDNPNRYAFPSYIKFAPYEQLNTFPTMQVYKSNSAQANSFDTNAYKKLIDTEEVDVDTSAYNFRIKESDIIFTYRAVRSQYISNKQLIESLKKQDAISVSKIYEAAILLLVDHSMKSFIIDGPIGSDSRLESYVRQFVHAHFATRIAGKNYNAQAARIVYMAYTLINKISTLSTMLLNDMVGTDKETKVFAKKVSQRISNLKETLLEFIKDDGTTQGVFIKHWNKFKTYQHAYALIFANVLQTIAKLTSDFIDVSKTKSVYLDRTIIIKKTVNETIAGMLLHTAIPVGIISREIPRANGLSTLKWTSMNGATFTDKINNVLRARITPTITSKGSTKASELYDSNFKTRYPEIKKVIKYITHLHLINKDTTPAYSNAEAYYQKLSYAFNNASDNIKDIITDNIVVSYAQLSDREDIADRINREGITPNESQDRLASQFSTKGTPIYASFETTWKNFINRDRLFFNTKSMNNKEFYITCNSGILSMSVFSSKLNSINNRIKRKHLIVRNKEDSVRKIQTTITKFEIGMKNNNIPIFMEGHDGPIVQNLAGPDTNINLSIVTNDVFLLDNIATVSQELDLAYRTKLITDNTSPLGRSFTTFRSDVQTNSLIYNTTRKRTQSKFNRYIKRGATNIGNDNSDIPIIITNNIANMAGIYGVVINEIQINTVEGFPGLYQIDLNMMSVDISQRERETPRKIKHEIPPELILANMCRLNPYVIHSYISSDKSINRGAELTSALFHYNNMAAGVNYSLAQLAYIYWLTEYVLKGAKSPFVFTNGDRDNKIIGIKNAEEDNQQIGRTQYLHSEILTLFTREFIGKELLPIIDTMYNGVSYSSAMTSIRNKFKELFDRFTGRLSDINLAHVRYTVTDEDDNYQSSSIKLPLLDFYRNKDTAKSRVELNEDLKEKELKYIYDLVIPRRSSSGVKTIPMALNKFRVSIDDEPQGDGLPDVKFIRQIKELKENYIAVSPLKLLILNYIQVNSGHTGELDYARSAANISSTCMITMGDVDNKYKKMYQSIPSDTLYFMNNILIGLMGFRNKDQGSGMELFTEIMETVQNDKSNLDIILDKSLAMVVQSVKEMHKLSKLHDWINSNDKYADLGRPPANTNINLRYLASVVKWRDSGPFIKEFIKSGTTPIPRAEDPGTAAKIAAIYGAIFGSVATLGNIEDGQVDLNKVLVGQSIAPALYGEYTYATISEAILKSTEKLGTSKVPNLRSRLSALRIMLSEIPSLKRIKASPMVELRYTNSKNKLLYNSDKLIWEIADYRRFLTTENVFDLRVIKTTFGQLIPESMLDFATQSEVEKREFKHTAGTLIKDINNNAIVNLKYKLDLIMYRLIDATSMRVVIPMLSHFNTKNNFKENIPVNGEMDLLGLYSIINGENDKQILGLRTRNLSKGTNPLEPDGDPREIRILEPDSTFGGHAKLIISPLLIVVLTNTILSKLGKYYDMYNAYPDRPLPLIHRANGDIGKGIVAALQLFTTPDFYIKRDTNYANYVVGTLENKIRGAQEALDYEEQNGSQDIASSDDIDKENISMLNQESVKVTNDIIASSYSAVVQILNDMVYGTQDTVGNGQFYEAFQKAHNLTPIQMDLIDNEAGPLIEALWEIRDKFEELSTTDIDEQFNVIKEGINNYTKLLGSANAGAGQRTAYKIIAQIGKPKEQLDDAYRILESTKSQVENSSRPGKIAERLKTKGAQLSSSDLEFLKSILNPSSGAFNNESMNIMKNKLRILKNKLVSVTPISSLAYSLPTFKLYIIEEDAKEWLFFNDFYDYASVKSIKIHSSRKDATETAHIMLSNVYGRLTNVIAGRRSNVENPFALRGSEEEEVSSMMLREGARIQVRMGYSAHLGVDSIVFSGRIQQLQGTHEIVIVAQSDGIELTRTVGTGPGTDFGGILDRFLLGSGFTNTNNSLGLVTAILDASGQALRGLGTRVPYLGNSRMRNVTSENIAGVTTALEQKGRLISFIESIVKDNVLASVVGISPKLIDTRLTNVNLSPAMGFNGWFETLFGRSRWMLHNETIWDALQDYMLQLGDRICTVRPFDEENTIVIDSEDGIYQRSTEDFISSSIMYNIISELENGEKSARYAIRLLYDLLKQESSFADSETKTPPIYKMIRSVLVDTANGLPNKEKIFGTSSNTAKAATIAEQINKIVNEAMKVLLAKDPSILSQLTTVDSAAYKLDNSSYHAIQDIRDRINKKITTGEVVRPTRNNNTGLNILSEYLIALSASMLCTLLKHHVASGTKSFRPVSDVHLKISRKDIIKNDIRVTAGFNSVELGYIDEDIFGSVLSTFGFGEIANIISGGFIRSISIDNINKPSSYVTTTVTASPFIDPEKKAVYSTEQKNAAIRGSILRDTPKIVANSILANLVRDYYDGELIILMDPTIKPYDTVMIHDDTNDMWGIIQVKEVTHSFSPETGAVTIIKPDMAVRNTLSGTRNTYTAGFNAPFILRASTASMSAVLTIATLGVGSLVARFIGAPIINGLSRFAKGPGKSLANKGLKLVLKSITASNIDNAASSVIGKKAMDTIFDIAESSGKNFNKLSVGKISKGFKNLMGDAATEPSTLTKAAKVTTSSLDDVIDNLSTKDLELNKDTISAIKKAYSESINKETFGIDDIFKEIKAQEAGGLIGNSSSDNVLELFTRTLVEDTDNIISSSSLFMDRLRKVSIKDGTSIGKNVLRAVNPFGGWSQLSSIIALSLSHKLGSAFTPTFDGFSSFVGEFLNQKPISISGLVHKGEPLVGNLDGMRRGEIHNLYDFLSYKINEIFNPLRRFAGDVQEQFYSVNKNAQKDDTDV